MTVTAHRVLPHRCGIWQSPDHTCGWWCMSESCGAEHDGLSEVAATLEARNHEASNWGRP